MLGHPGPFHHSVFQSQDSIVLVCSNRIQAARFPVIAKYRTGQIPQTLHYLINVETSGQLSSFWFWVPRRHHYYLLQLHPCTTVRSPPIQVNCWESHKCGWPCKFRQRYGGLHYILGLYIRMMNIQDILHLLRPYLALTLQSKFPDDSEWHPPRGRAHPFIGWGGQHLQVWLHCRRRCHCARSSRGHLHDSGPSPVPLSSCASLSCFSSRATTSRTDPPW